MPTGTMTSVISIGSVSLQSSVSRTAAGEISHEVSLPAAVAGTLSTRTSDTEGVFTLSGHDLAVNDVIDVYWDGGLRYGMKVTAVSGDDVTAGGIGGSGDEGAGDVLPDQGNSVNVDEQAALDTDFDGDKVEMIVVMSTKRGHFDFQDSGGTSLEAGELTAYEPWQWVSASGITNPLAGNPVDSLKLSNGDPGAEATVKVGVIYNSDQ